MITSRKVALALIAVSLLSIVYSAYALVTTLTIPSNGRIAVLDAYWNPECTNSTGTVNWGQSIPPNSTTDITLYIKNWGGNAMNLSLTVNWIPANMTNYCEITWDRENYELPSLAVIQCNFTLTVYEDATQLIGDTSFLADMIVHGTW